MPELIIKHPNRAVENLVLNRLRATIGRSARNDVCIADPFASRVHAEVRCEGDRYVLRDLNSANGTFYNSQPVTGPMTLSPGGCIQIGETEIVFSDQPQTMMSGATMIADAAPFLPTSSIAVSSGNRSTSGLLQEIAGVQSEMQARGAAARDDRNNLLALISKVGVTLLASASLDETLSQIVALVLKPCRPTAA
ncbi:MAG: FHA domain-containing protein [Pyrinomonadaceae bacterium]